jgi:hypothetical protein
MFSERKYKAQLLSQPPGITENLASEVMKGLCLIKVNVQVTVKDTFPYCSGNYLSHKDRMVTCFMMGIELTFDMTNAFPDDRGIDLLCFERSEFADFEFVRIPS